MYVRDQSNVCPGCDIHRTKPEFERDGFVFEYCVTCRNRKPKLRKKFRRIPVVIETMQPKRAPGRAQC
jgi:hypothetical protein